MLVHGTRLSHTQWAPYDGLFPELEVVAPDLPGHGTRVGERFTTDAAVGAIGAAVESGAPGLPVVLVGHSLGADDAIRLVGAAGAAAVATDLLVTFDPVFLGTVPAGPRLVLNFHQRGGLWGRALAPAPGFSGRIENIVLERAPGLHHFNIEKQPTLHGRVVAALDAMAPPG